MNKVVTFSTNQSYIEYAISLSKNIKKYTDCSILCRCVNCSEDSILKLRDIGVHVIDDKKQLSLKKRVKNPSDTPIILEGKFNRNQLCNDETTYTCHSRFLNIKESFELFKDCIVFAIDVDFIILKDFSEVFDMDEDVSMMDRQYCVHEDAICIKNGDSSIKFINDVIFKIEENPFFWDQDTIALKYAFEKNPSISFKEMDVKFKDFNLNDESLIWSGDGQSKFKEKFKEKCH